MAKTAKSEVQRATAGVRTSTAKAARIGWCYLFTALVYHECACAFAPLHAGVWVAPQALLAPVRYWLMRGVRYFTPTAAAPPTYVSWGDEQAASAPC